MAAHKAQVFEDRRGDLERQLREWFDRESVPVDGILPTTDGSILQMSPAISSKQVLDTAAIVEAVLGTKLPPSIIKPGGYRDFPAMLADIIPKLRTLFVEGRLPAKGTKAAA